MQTQALAECHLFQHLPPADLERVAAIAIPRRYRKGDIIFQDGARADGFYAVLSGKVKVYKLSQEGKEQILHIIGPGGTFGDAAVFTGETYPASAAALARTEAVFLPKAAFVRMLKQNPQLVMNLLAGLSQMLREFNALIEELSLKEVSARVAKYLLDAAVRSPLGARDGTVINLEITKAQLAARLGTVSETLSRTLRKLRRASLIRVRGRRIWLLDISRLRQVEAGLAPASQSR